MQHGQREKHHCGKDQHRGDLLVVIAQIVRNRAADPRDRVLPDRDPIWLCARRPLQVEDRQACKEAERHKIEYGLQSALLAMTGAPIGEKP